MNTRRLLPFAFVLITALTLLAQSAPAVPNDGLEILTRVGKHYADAKSYHIQAVHEYASHNELQRNWQKELLEAAETPGNKFHYEGRGGIGSAVRISDGTQVWSCHIDGHVYTVMPAGVPPNERHIISFSEMALFQAQSLQSRLS